MICESMLSTKIQKLLQCTVAVVNQTALRALCFFLTHGQCEASFVSLCYQTRLPWWTTVLCALRGYAAEPGSLKRGSGSRWLSVNFREKCDETWSCWTPLVAYALLSIKMPYNVSSFILRQGKKRAKNSFSMGLSYICCAIQHNGEVWWRSDENLLQLLGSVITQQPEPHAQRERKERGRGKREQVWPKISISGNLCRVPINYMGSGAPMTE